MPQLLYLLYKVLRMGPLGLGVIAAAILGFGYYIQVETNKRHALEAAALAAGPPAVVAIEDANGMPDTTGVKEVVVEAQLLWNYSYDLWYEKELTTDYVVMFPLVAAGSTDPDTVVGIAIFEAEDSSFETLSPDLFEEWMSGEGEFGPVMNLNGKVRGMGQWDGLIEDSFYDLGLTLPSDVFVVWPYVEGREVAFAAPADGAMSMFGLFSKIAGGFALFALAKLVISNKTTPSTPQQSGVGPTAPLENPAYDQAVSSTRNSDGVPLWKQRAGLVDEAGNDDAPATFEHAHFDKAPDTKARTITKPMYEPLVTPQRSGFGVRKMLVGVIGGLFFLGLGATVYDLISKSSPAASTATLVTPGEVVAAGVADVVVPDADPDRHWTDIDVTPIVEWFVAKGLLAFAGDTDAQITLAMIAGGVFFAMFMVRYFFMMRMALRPKTTPRFDSMGLN